MDVRRLLARLRGGLLAFFRPRPVKPSSVTAKVATGVAAAAPVSVATPNRARRMGIASWLEDGRRLRVRASFSRSQGGGRSSASSSQSAPPRLHPGLPTVPGNQVPRLGPAAGNLAASETTPHVLASTSPSPASSALPPDIRVDFTDELSAATLGAIEGMDATQRRLIFLRYLVRQGVYNEGFGERLLPEQYWRSRGVDGPASDQ